MKSRRVLIGILTYPSMFKSGLHGIQEMIDVANSIQESFSAQKRQIRNVSFELETIPVDRITFANKVFDVIIILPGIGDNLLKEIDKDLQHFLVSQYEEGAILSSACSGLFLLAKTGVLTGKVVTTQEDLGDIFRKSFPGVHLIENKTVVEDGNIVTAAGVSKWMHLILTLIGRYTHRGIINNLADFFQVDLEKLSLRRFNQISAVKDHNDISIKKVQRRIHEVYWTNIDFDELSSFAGMSRRTLQRRFKKATHLTPIEYLRNFRLERACILLEATDDSIENIVREIGYDDIASFRKLFKDKTGVTPKKFRSLSRNKD